MDAKEATDKEETVIGCTDGFRQGYVEGWAWRPGKPHDTVIVQLLVDGQVVGESTACLPRPDLSTAGIGHGQHAFAIPFTIEPEHPPVLHLSVRAKDGAVLPPGEFEIETSAETRADLTRRRSVAYLEKVFGPISASEPPLRRAPAPPAVPRLNFVLYTARSGGAVASTLGMPEYSYVFVMRGFREVLRRLGTVHVVHDPDAVDPIHDACLARGESCLLLSFAPPQSTPLGLRCPTIPVIAWEFSTIPDGWPGDVREDWRLVLRQTGRAITISDFAARALRAGMGAHFPVAAIPTPVWDRLSGLRSRLRLPHAPQAGGPVELRLEGFVWDSRVAKLSLTMRAPPLPGVKQQAAPRPFPIRGAQLALAMASRAAQQEAREAAARDAESAAQAARDAASAAQAARDAGAGGRGKTLRMRAGTTLRLGRQWYREVVRDALPRPVIAALSAGGRAAMALRERPAAPLENMVVPVAIVADSRQGAPLAISSEHAIAKPAGALPPNAPYLPVGDIADKTRPYVPPTHLPAADDAPLPEPELADFRPDPYPAEPAAAIGEVLVQAEGVIFTAVLSPKDGRKNWQDILTAFIAAFRDEKRATLILKMIGADANYWWWEFHTIVKALPPFDCRVLVVSGYLAYADYEKLIAATHFVVNASLAEGQCLPLVEFMSGGRPAIAPLHTAMLDYITPQNAVIVTSAIEFCSWPHDPRNYLITTRHRVEWASIRDAFGEAWRILHEDPERYAAMAQAAAASVRGYCADAVVAPSLSAFLGLGDAAVQRAGWAPLPTAPADPLP